MDEINQFRQTFFDKVIETEKKKEQEERLVRANCFHVYKIIGDTYDNRDITYQQRTCSKCGHSTIRRIELWGGPKRCDIL